MRRRGRPSSTTGQARWIIGAFLFVAPFSLTVASGPIDGNQPSPIDESLGAIRVCMDREPAPWPDAWQQEYVNTIRQAITLDPNTAQYARHLQILREGFPLYWTAQKFTADRSHFEVRQAEIRWYVENLMDANLPGEEETSRLRRQHEELAHHGVTGLLAQFSFLDPNVVQKAKVDYLTECRHHVDAPLIPIYLALLSEAQMRQMKQRWHDMRYGRVDLWRSLGGNGVIEAQNPTHRVGKMQPGNQHPDHLLTQRSLDQLRGQLWSLIPTPPDYYQEAVTKQIAANKQRLQAMTDARSQEERLGVAVWQTEYLSFLLAALLETAEVSQGGDVK